MKKIFITLLTTLNILFLSVLSPVCIYAQEPSNFDFDSWYKDAKIAYDNFVNILHEKENEPSVSQLYTNADLLTRVSLGEKQLYVKSVKNGTEEEWESFTPIELFVYKSTYLNFVGMMNESKESYENSYKSGQEIKENTFRSAVGLSGAYGEDGEEIFYAYLDFAEYQLQYYEYYSFPYNFVTNKSYAEETGLETLDETSKEETLEDLESLGFTQNEISEIESALNEEEQSNTNSMNLIFIIIPIVLVLVIGIVTILRKKGKNN